MFLSGWAKPPVASTDSRDRLIGGWGSWGLRDPPVHGEKSSDRARADEYKQTDGCYAPSLRIISSTQAPSVKRAAIKIKKIACDRLRCCSMNFGRTFTIKRSTKYQIFET